MSDFWLLFIFAIICILIAYGLGYQIGFGKGRKDKYYEALLEQAEKVMEVKTKMNKLIDRENYCKDCKRSIYGEYKNCDINIENNGKYVGPPNQECSCKIAEVKDYRR